MAFKTYHRNPSFLDLELEQAFGTSRAQQFLREIDSHIDWEPCDDCGGHMQQCHVCFGKLLISHEELAKPVKP